MHERKNNALHTLIDYGWNDRWQAQFEQAASPGLTPGRVTAVHRDRCVLMTPAGSVWGRPSGALRTRLDGAPPTVGDMAALYLPPAQGEAVLESLLPRRTALARQSVHHVHERQAIAANIDLAAIAASLNQDLNPARLERYLTVAWNSGARPAILLTKADLCDDAASAEALVEAIAPGVPVVTLSAQNGQGLEAVRALWRPGETAVVLGSSGVGKSTLLNALLGYEAMATRAIRQDDDHGRHTTTHRELFRLDCGRLLIDTPGLREIAFDSGSQTFSDIETLAGRCRFADCAHRTEPGCAVLEAIASGELSGDRLERYRKYQREEHHEQAKTDAKVRADLRQRDRDFGKMVRQVVQKKR